MGYMKRRAQDVLSCLKRIDSFTNGQAFVQDWDYEEMAWIKIQIRPNDGPYQGGMFDFEFDLSGSFPFEPPSVLCKTVIFHPNIDPDNYDSNVCLNLFDEWTNDFGLEDAIQGLLFLMHYPNLEDPLSPYIEPQLSEDDFKCIVQQSMRGETVEDVNLVFKCVMVDHNEKIETADNTCICKKNEKGKNKAENEEEEKQEQKEEEIKEEEVEEEEVKPVEFFEELHGTIIQTLEEKMTNFSDEEDKEEVGEEEEEEVEEECPTVLDIPADKTISTPSTIINNYIWSDPSTDISITLTAVVLYSGMKFAYQHFFPSPEPIIYVTAEV